VRIPVDAMVTEPLSVSDAARVQEFLVRYRVELEVVDASNAVLLPLAPIELTRDFSYDETQALGAAAEEELLRKELRREMVQQVLRRIERLGRTP
jgi:LPS-assembly lipoprotein